MSTKILKCKFCDYTVLAWRTTNGKHKSGWSLLQQHVMLKHPEEYEKVLLVLEEEESLRNIRR